MAPLTPVLPASEPASSSGGGQNIAGKGPARNHPCGRDALLEKNDKVVTDQKPKMAPGDAALVNCHLSRGASLDKMSTAVGD